jgi:hypothetical protein
MAPKNGFGTKYCVIDNNNVEYSLETWEKVFKIINSPRLEYNKVMIMKNETFYLLQRKLPKDIHSDCMEKYYDSQYPEYAQHKTTNIFWILCNITNTQEINDLIVKLHTNGGITYPEYQYEYMKLTLSNIFKESNLELLGNI